MRAEEGSGLFSCHLNPLKLTELPLRRILHRAQIAQQVRDSVLLVLKRLVVVAVVRLACLDEFSTGKEHPTADGVLRDHAANAPLLVQLLDRGCRIAAAYVLWN